MTERIVITHEHDHGIYLGSKATGEHLWTFDPGDQNLAITFPTKTAAREFVSQYFENANDPGVYHYVSVTPSLGFCATFPDLTRAGLGHCFHLQTRLHAPTKFQKQHCPEQPHEHRFFQTSFSNCSRTPRPDRHQNRQAQPPRRITSCLLPLNNPFPHASAPRPGPAQRHTPSPSGTARLFPSPATQSCRPKRQAFMPDTISLRSFIATTASGS